LFEKFYNTNLYIFGTRRFEAVLGKTCLIFLPLFNIYHSMTFSRIRTFFLFQLVVFFSFTNPNAAKAQLQLFGTAVQVNKQPTLLHQNLFLKTVISRDYTNIFKHMCFF